MRQLSRKLLSLLWIDAPRRPSGATERQSDDGDEHEQYRRPQRCRAAGIPHEWNCRRRAIDEVPKCRGLGEAVERRGAQQYRQNCHRSRSDRQRRQVVERIDPLHASGASGTSERRHPRHGHAVHLEGVSACEPPSAEDPGTDPHHRRVDQ